MSRWRPQSGRWKIDGIDVRLIVALIVPLGLALGWGLAKNPDAVAAAVQVVRGGTTAISAPAASDIIGVASVTDGDSIEIHGLRIRLDGIDAPEGRQLCKIGGQSYHCGQEAALHLSSRIGRQQVRCSRNGVDQYGRILAICYMGDEDLNAMMVRDGQALAYRHYSRRYVGEENAARAARRGVWAGEFDMPWDWRRRN